MSAPPRLGKLSDRTFVAWGTGAAGDVDKLCELITAKLYGKAKDWRCDGLAEGRNFVLQWMRQGASGAPKKLTATDVKDLRDAINLAWAETVDPAAIQEYESRSLTRADTAVQVDVHAPKGILTQLGPLVAVTYDGTLQGEPAYYQHTFEPYARPILAVDEANTLHIVGGDYTVEDVGITDGDLGALTPKENPADWLAYEHLEQARRLLARAYRVANTAQRTLEDVPGPEWMKFGKLADAISALHSEAWDMVPEKIRGLADRQLPGPALTPEPEENPKSAEWVRRRVRSIAESIWREYGRLRKLVGEPNAGALSYRSRETLDRASDHLENAWHSLASVTGPRDNAHFPGKLGTGQRFAECVEEVSDQPGVYDPEGLCAAIGRAKYGKKEYARLAREGRQNPVDIATGTMLRAKEAAHVNQGLVSRGLESSGRPRLGPGLPAVNQGLVSRGLESSAAPQWPASWPEVSSGAIEGARVARATPEQPVMRNPYSLSSPVEGGPPLATWGPPPDETFEQVAQRLFSETMKKSGDHQLTRMQSGVDAFKVDVAPLVDAETAGARASRFMSEDPDRGNLQMAWDATEIGWSGRPAAAEKHGTYLLATDGNRVALLPTTKRMLGLTRKGKDVPDYVPPAGTVSDLAQADASMDKMRESLASMMSTASGGAPAVADARQLADLAALAVKLTREAKGRGEDNPEHRIAFDGGGAHISRGKIHTELFNNTREQYRPLTVAVWTGANKKRKEGQPKWDEAIGEQRGTSVGPTLTAKFVADALRNARGNVRIRLSKSTPMESPVLIEREDGEAHLIMGRRMAP